jgi:small subunit ribosomal protein S15
VNEEISRIFAPELHNNHLNNIGMYLTKEKAEIFAKHGQSATDTGSSEGQIALFTFQNQPPFSTP